MSSSSTHRRKLAHQLTSSFKDREFANGQFEPVLAEKKTVRMMRPSSIEELLEKTEVVRKESPENIQVAARLRRDKVIRTLVMEFNTKSSTRDREK